ncbi:hypothetical protein I3U85_13715 [Mycobacteroides abscessus subsp. abscessus]|uniref:hypothetical protein n=1 Tax=Mycobacteroides abscessus TaxID=36809 RepID=UPI0019CFF16A|nr:hypothetical protein [Mycobacteroides abscessus]MBN7535249.1 hypothetical protein [Mycobacteroides abscessus subsp. abscessus]
MADRLVNHDAVSPRKRVRNRADDGYFYPGEVAEMLGVRSIDYHQLRGLFHLIREQSGGGETTRGWSRYTLTDVAALRVALDLCGGADALQKGRHLRLGNLAAVCRALRAQGIANPLLDVQLRRQRSRVYAVIRGTMFDPLTGQTVLADTTTIVTRYVQDENNPALNKKLWTESRRKPRRTKHYDAQGIIPLDIGGSDLVGDGSGADQPHE